MLRPSSLRSLRAQAPQDGLPPSWLCPVLTSTYRAIGTSTVNQARHSEPGRLKTHRRKVQAREGGFVRESARLLEYGRHPTDASHTRKIVDDRVEQELVRFRELLAQGELAQAWVVLEGRLGPRALETKDAFKFARLLHHQIRRRLIAAKDAKEIIEKFMQWYKQREIPGHPRVTGYLLCCYRDRGEADEGAKFWEWARRQMSMETDVISSWTIKQATAANGAYTDLRTYGTALAVMAMAGHSFEQTEAAYLEGVRRYSRGFNEYHLNPTAWLSNPDQASYLPGASVGLMEGLMHSRFIHGKVAAAYVGYDTVLKLYPFQVPGGIQVDISKERPLSEQIQTLRIQLRAGNTASEPYITTILNGLREWMRVANSGHADILRTMLSIVRLASINRIFVGAPQLNVLIRSLLQRLGPNATTLEQEACSKAVKEMVELFDAFGVKPNDETVRQSLTEIMAHPNVPVGRQLLAAMVSSATPLSDQVNSSLLQYLMESYGQGGLHQEILELWTGYTEAATTADKPLPRSDSMWRSLTKSLAYSAVRHARNATSTASTRDSTALDEAHYQKALDAAKQEHKNFLGKAMDAANLGPAHHSERLDVIRIYTEEVLKAAGPLEPIYPETPDAGAGIFDTFSDLIGDAKRNLSLGNRLDLNTEDARRVSVLPRSSPPQEWQLELFNELVLGPDGGMYFEQLKGQLTETDESSNSMQPPSQNAPPQPSSLPGAHVWRPVSEVSDKDERKVTTESPTGIPLLALRYQNWCDVNHLLLEAEAFEEILSERVDGLIESGQSGDVRRMRTTYSARGKLVAKVLSKQWELYQEVQKRVQPLLQNKDAWMVKVRELRKDVRLDEKPSGWGEMQTIT